MTLERIYEELKDIRTDVKQLRADFNRYRGFFHGVMWCIGVLTACVGFVLGLGNGGG